MKIIKLSNGKEVQVDEENYINLSRFKWHYYNGYAATTIMMHDMLLCNYNNKVVIDHENRNGLDNRRTNLRKATHSQNSFNREKSTNNTSGFKGVSFHKKNNCWIANITINGKLKYLGSFQTPEDASVAYDKAAIEVAGKFAKLNNG